MKFIVDGKIVGKARPRFTRQGHCYTPKATVLYEKWIANNYKKENGILFQNPIVVKIIANIGIPKSATKKFKENALNGIEKPTKKPDADNIAKAVLDALNKVAYSDDKQVIGLSVKKRYAEKEFLEIEVEEICIEQLI